ncbi:O-fucosyltransferase 15-like [Malania oleifera]|uniref:O-fucosyltransferase 15-like n=1 Tax=Malania oleifera TaxID=397392 RepID=UPI0025AE3277|nr:O-fucosyltransferase 15-like [Malania oleifera]XP_057962508.1 O-fucosyltransferase 15-like [Malania oleifera]XP_057962510.1 O-fucosyltransferase 15-like [Malania oleifera]XP_057962511.1 O-fucosyltransferase 15-like [Malania oleifera]
MASPCDLSNLQDDSNLKLVSDPQHEVEAEVSRLHDIRVAGRTSSHGRSLSATPRSRASSPRSFWDNGFGSVPNRFSDSHGGSRSSRSAFSKIVWFPGEQKQIMKRSAWYRLALIGVLVFFLLVNWWMLLSIEDNSAPKGGFVYANSSLVQGKLRKIGKGKKQQNVIYGRLLALAAHALAENKPEPKDLWLEPLASASAWRPCAEQRNWKPSGNNRYIMVSANGGINQQRIAVCNAVVIARLFSSTLVLPKFLYSSVWNDVSQFGDIYQEEHFIDYLKLDIRIVKELPKELQSLDLEAIGSVITDADIRKEAKPSFYLKNILPVLRQNRVVHFIGFGNRLAFDPIPFQLQRLRCRCNFHALKFIPKIQETGALLLERMRQHAPHSGLLDHYLIGPFAEPAKRAKKGHAAKNIRYLSLHLRFEIDMAAHSLCDFGGGEEERRELEAYREMHFPALTLLKRTAKLPSPAELRSEGLCPLTPEEAVLMLAALGFRRKTHIFLAGAHIYGGRSRLAVLTNLFPNLVTKENLLSSSEIEPFRNFSSQLAALDFIGSTAADAFAMTDSGSQFSALVSGYRIYYGGGRMPTIRPNKRRLANIFLKNNTIEWRVFEQRVRKAIRQTKRAKERPVARSVYRHPRCKECMCFAD